MFTVYICLSVPLYAGVDFYSKALEIDNKIISLQLWDTAGQERFQSVTKAYYRGAQGIVLVYDISQEESFIAVKSWISTIQVCSAELGSLVPKQDLLDNIASWPIDKMQSGWKTNRGDERSCDMAVNAQNAAPFPKR